MTLPTQESANLADVTEEIISMLRAEAGVANLTADSTLQDGGLDSLKVMSLVLKIETRYDIELDADDAEELRTVGDLGRLVVRLIEKRR
ncbi:acyl carrier protein [Mycobacterium sp.]|jgi:acyl carrier protein|uniref:acyl carrier protein n=1 Tax=Mycobacterium sp. TaxID=1785 RepID=UPI002D4508EC|nr:acyl carrier protein [Mycobacterium sp.]HZA10180.1 acyl carrier protein [Mycobacterium sp.]